MKLIGIIVNTGTGKTTFTKHLEKRENVGVIHIDDLVSEIKKKYFKMFLQSKEKNTTENTQANPKLKSGVKKFFYRNKIAFSFLMKVRSKLIEKDLHKKIADFEKSGKDLIVIDDWALSTHKKLYKKLNRIYTIERPYLSRRKGIQERDALATDELKVCDLPYALGFLKGAEGENTEIITNSGTIRELQDKADLAYEKLIGLSFDEKYSCKDKVDVRSAVKALRKSTSRGEHAEQTK